MSLDINDHPHGTIRPKPSYRQCVRNSIAKIAASYLHKSVGIKRSVLITICPIGGRSDLVTPVYNPWNGQSYAGSGSVRLACETRYRPPTA